MIFDEVAQHLFKLYTGGLRQTTFLSGPPGIAKSACVRYAATMVAEHYGLPFQDYSEGRSSEAALVDGSNTYSHFGFQPLPMTVVDPLDFGGLPAVIDGEARRIKFTDLIPQRGAGIVLYDDLPTAPPLTQAAAYRTIWERDGIGKDWMIVATGNRAEDRAAVQHMPRPLVSKMGWIAFKEHLPSWLLHMAAVEGNVLIRAFLQHVPNAFCDFKPEVPGPFACPRTWDALSEVLNVYHPNLPPFDVIKGWVGESHAIEFQQFAQMAHELITVDEILAAPSVAHVPKDPGALYVISTGLSARIDANSFGQVLTYLNRMPAEYSIFCVKSALTTDGARRKALPVAEQAKYRRIDQTPAFRDFGAKNLDLLA